MTLEKYVRIIAGTFILMSVALAIWVSPWWLLWTTLVGANLVQSAFTGWCPAEILLKKLGLPGSCCASKDTGVCNTDPSKK